MEVGHISSLDVPATNVAVHSNPSDLGLASSSRGDDHPVKPQVTESLDHGHGTEGRFEHLLWMDEILHHLRNPGMLIPL